MAPSRIRQFLTRHGWLVAIAAAYLYVVPYFPRIHSANELPRVYLVKAIVDDHTFAIDREVARWGGTYDLAQHDRAHPAWTPCPRGRAPEPGGEVHDYQNKAPGASFVVVPFYAVARLFGEPGLGATMWLCRIVAGVIPSLALLWLMWRFLERYAPDPAARRLALVAYALGSMAMTYSLLYYGHQLSAACIAGAWILALDVADRRRGLVTLALAGVLAGMAPLVDYQAAFAGIPIAIHVLWKLRAWPRREVARAVAVAAAGAAVPIALLLYYHAACFGSPLHTGYDYSVDCEHTSGFLGMTHPMWTAFAGITIAPDNGLVTLAPWWLLAIPGGIVLWRRGDRATVVTIAAIAAIYLLFVSSLGFWRAGWEVGPRYLTAMQPFLLPLVAAALSAWRERPLVLGAAAGAIVVGVVVYTTSAATFPYWPDSIKNPLYDVTFRLLSDHAAAPTVLRACGISGLLSIVPFLAGIAAVVGWAITRASNLRGLALAAMIGALVIGLYALAPHNHEVASGAYARTLFPAVAQ